MQRRASDISTNDQNRQDFLPFLRKTYVGDVSDLNNLPQDNQVAIFYVNRALLTLHPDKLSSAIKNEKVTIVAVADNYLINFSIKEKPATSVENKEKILKKKSFFI